MLTKRQNSLIDFLLIHKSASSAAIAENLHLSKRTVINYVRSINDTVPNGTLIISTSKGYTLDAQVYARMQMAAKLSSADSFTERIPFILKKLLSSYQDKINIYQISEELCYSESAIRADLYQLGKTAKKFDLDIRLNKNSAFLTGAEMKKREFYFSIFQDSIDRDIFDLSRISLLFPDFDGAKLYRILTECTQKYHRNMTDYEIVNVLYRLLVSMERVRRGHYIDANRLYLNYVRGYNIALAREMAIHLEKHFDIRLPESEIMHLALLFAAVNVYGDTSQSFTVDNLEQNLWPECYALVQQIIDSVEDIYSIRLRDIPEDYIEFALHVRALIRRAHGSIRLQNPYKETIKQENAAIFDCAVYAANQISQKYNIPITDDDIADLSPSFARSVKSNINQIIKVNTLFVLPSYYNFHNTLYQFYCDLLQDYITPHHTTFLSNYTELDKIDLIVSTLPLKPECDKQIIQINPIRNTYDQQFLLSTVKKLQWQRISKDLQMLLENITKNDYFYLTGNEVITQEAALEHLIAPLVKDGVVGSDFLASVLDRERQSSTVMGQVAFPHEAVPTATKNTLSILISDVPIQWNGGKARVIVLPTAMPGEYMPITMKVLHRLSNVLEHKGGGQKLLKCKNWQDVIDILLV